MTYTEKFNSYETTIEVGITKGKIIQFFNIIEYMNLNLEQYGGWYRLGIYWQTGA